MKTIRKENTIICDAKIEETSGEVDIDLKYDVLGKKLADAAYEEDGFNMIDKGFYTENYPVKISILKKIISKIEKSGCNYISIDYNCDHPDYTFCGIDAHQATDEEVNEEVEKDKNKKLDIAKQNLANLKNKETQILEEIKKLEGNV